MNDMAFAWIALGLLGFTLLGMFYLAIRIERVYDRLNRRIDSMSENTSLRIDRLNGRIDSIRQV